MSAATTPVKVDAQTGRLIAESAHFLRSTQKDVVDQAVREFVDNHRDEINRGVRDALDRLDGSNASAISLLSGFSPERISALGGLPE